MPYEIRGARPNREAIVQVTEGGQDVTKRVRGPKEVIYSDTLTKDMRTQKKMSYINYVFFTEPVNHGKELTTSTVEASPEPVNVVLDPPVEVRYFTDDEILALTPGQVEGLLAQHPELDLDISQEVEEIQMALLNCQLPWVDPSELEE